jgi:predicted amidohydrolase
MAVWFLMCLSALLYASAFIALDSLWWLSFICFVPLFYGALLTKLSFAQGLIWGIIAFGIHLSGFFYSIYHLADNPSWQLSFLLMGALGYLALHAALWFYVTQLIAQILDIKNNVVLLLLWIATTWLFINYIDHYCLWPFNQIEGLILLNPLLPLVRYPVLLTNMHLLGKSTVLLVLLLFQASITALLYSIKTSRFALLTSVMVTTLGALVGNNSATKLFGQAPQWLKTVAVLPEAFYNPHNTQKTMSEVKSKLQELLTERPQASVILMPESALFLCDLSAHKKLIKQWDKAHLGKEATIITGGITYENGNSYNTAYLVHNGQIKNNFKKRHSMLLTENITSWLNFSFVQSCYYTQRPPITRSTNTRNLFVVSQELQLVPYICSELFFNEQPDDAFPNQPVLALCNDTWVIPEYVKKLMYTTAHFKALQWGRPVLYVAYEYAYYFDGILTLKL